MRWYPVTHNMPNIKVNGLAWFVDNKGAFLRLPFSRRQEITPVAWQMSKHPSSARVRFKTDSSQLRLKITHGMQDTKTLSMWHMSSVAVSGIDLYLGTPGEQVFWMTTRPQDAIGQYEHLYFEKLALKVRELTLYLPIYAELSHLEIGIDAQAVIESPSDYTVQKPIVFYGSSITQGGCSSRGSNNFVSILGRRLNADVINLGFSGSGCGEAVMAELMAEINASIYVVDSVANMGEHMQSRYADFVKILRRLRSEVPVVLMTRIHYADEFLPEKTKVYDKLHAPLLEIYNTLRQQGDNAVHLFDTGAVITPGGDHPSVDGIHLTDVGFYKLAARLEPFLHKIMR